MTSLCTLPHPNFYPETVATALDKIEFLSQHVAECIKEQHRLALDHAAMLSSTIPATLPTLLPASSLPDTSQHRNSVELADYMLTLLKSTSANLAEETEGEEKNTGIVRPVIETLRYDPHDTFGRWLFGPSFRSSLRLLAVLCILYTLGAFVGCLAVWRFVDSRLIFVDALAIPALFYGYLLLNRRLTFLVLRQQQTFVFHFWSVVFVVSMLFELREQQNFPGFANPFYGQRSPEFPQRPSHRHPTG
jgi:hypothetical protein